MIANSVDAAVEELDKIVERDISAPFAAALNHMGPFVGVGAAPHWRDLGSLLSRAAELAFWLAAQEASDTDE